MLRTSYRKLAFSHEAGRDACCSVRTVILHLALSAYGNHSLTQLHNPVVSNHQGAAEVRNSNSFQYPSGWVHKSNKPEAAAPLDQSSSRRENQ